MSGTDASSSPHPPGSPPRWPWRALAAALAAVAYVPLLLTAPSQISADTKSYLYLDPGRLVARATSMWDPNIALGYVPHQNIGYLWPSGPWYWAMDSLGLPDWVAQRLWWGTLLFTAGAGVMVLLRRLGWRVESAGVAAATYMLTPYVLSLIARLSGILLAYSALPWMVLLTALALRSRGWRHPALFALVAASAGSLNLTALVLVGLAPVAWLAHEVWVVRTARLRDGLAVAARIGVLTALVSAWWAAGLAVQAGYGNNVLRYSETAESVATTSTANEVLRGLGYWFFYGEDRLGPWIEPSVAYTQSLWLLAATYLIPTLALTAAAIARFRHRAYFVVLVLLGLVVAVGPYPWDDPSPLGRAIKAFLLTERGLAMRSLPRAAPLLVLGLGVFLGAGVGALLRRWPAAGRGAAAGIAVLVLVAQPTILTGDTVPGNLRRPEEVPDYWTEAAAHLDAGDQATHVLEIPGDDFASYRWGNTVDPITPGLVERDVAYRELIPFGPPESAAMLDAFDLMLQERTMDAEAIAPIARLIRAGDVLVRSDLAYERFNTPRPKNLWALVTSAPGLGDPAEFGPPADSPTDPRATLDDELWLLTDADLPTPPSLAAFPVTDPVSMLSAHSPAGPVLVAGDSFGLIDAAAAGRLDGTELIRFSSTLDRREVDAALDDGAVLLVTDTNRRRGERWQTIRHTKGYTEPAGLEPLAVDHTDNRLPILDGAGDDGRTVAVHRGGITANATSYGNRVTFEPATRPAAAVDGDPRTAWRAAGLSDARGERLQLDLDDPETTDRIRLLQPLDTGNRRLTRVELRFDGGDPTMVDLDASSLTEPGQLVTFPTRTFSRLEIEVVADDAGSRVRYAGYSSVGFAEVRIGDDDHLVLDELIRVPVDLLDKVGDRVADHPVAIVLSRLRQDPATPIRDDEERSLARLFDLPAPLGFGVTGQARLSARASDDALTALVRPPSDVHVTSTGRVAGSRAETGAAALDGDLSTAWMSPRGTPTGHGLRVQREAPITLDHLELAVRADGRHSVPTQLAVTADGAPPVTVDVPPIADATDPNATHTVTVPLPRPLTGRDIGVLVTKVREQTAVDWYTRGPVAQPVAIAELGIPGVSVPPTTERLDTGCRGDLLTVDGQPVPIRITGSTDHALAGDPLDVAMCGERPLGLSTGEHELRSAMGATVGLDLDRLVLSTPRAPGPVPAPASPEVHVRDTSSTGHRVEVSGDPGSTAWLVLGQSYSPGWSATVEGGKDLGAPVLVDGFANGWRVPLDGSGKAVVDLRFEPQDGVRASLVISLLGAALCLVLAWRGRRAPGLVPDVPQQIDLDAARYQGDRPSTWSVAVGTVIAATAGLLVLPPVLALVLPVAVIVLTRRPRGRWVLLAASPLLALATGAYVVLQQARHHIAPGTEWPMELDRVHHVALLAVLLLGVDALVERLWLAPPAPRSARPEADT
ncbi:MAG: alpha-(1-_3)-arabinofuranosyltransferase family protein [Acidimicrobiales bacterium]